MLTSAGTPSICKPSPIARPRCEADPSLLPDAVGDIESVPDPLDSALPVVDQYQTSSGDFLDVGTLSAAQLDADNARLDARIIALERELAAAQAVVDQKIKINSEKRATVAELERQLARLVMPMDAVASAPAATRSRAGGDDANE